MDATTTHVSDPKGMKRIGSPGAKLSGFKDPTTWMKREARWLAPLALLPLFLAAALISADTSGTKRAIVIVLPALFYCGYAISSVRHLERKLDQRQSRLEREMIRRVDELSPSGMRLSRQYFEARLDQEISRSQRHELPLCVVTVATSPERHRVVTTLRLSELTSQILRAEDSAGRLGRHVYGIYLPHTTPAGATVVVDRFRKVLAASEPEFGLVYLEPGREATAAELVQEALGQLPEVIAA